MDSISSVAFRIIMNKLLRIQQINNLFFFDYAEAFVELHQQFRNK